MLKNKLLCIFEIHQFPTDKEKPIVSDLLQRLNIRLLVSVAGELIWLNHLLTCFEVTIYSAILFLDCHSIIHLVFSPMLPHDRNILILTIISSKIIYPQMKSQHQLAESLRVTEAKSLFLPASQFLLFASYCLS
jgi:hypothetical protein